VQVRAEDVECSSHYALSPNLYPNLNPNLDSTISLRRCVPRM